jgi:ubiquinone biosynthesis protein UbiJ
MMAYDSEPQRGRQSAARRNPLLAGLTAAINRVILADEKTAYRVAELGECSIAFRLKRSGYTVLARVTHGAVSLSSDTDRADVTITGAPADFLAMAKTQRDGSALAAGKVDIEGDLATAQQIQALMADMSIDFEGLLAQRTGDVFARQVGRGVRAGIGWVRYAHAALERDLSEYLRFEVGLLPVREDIETFVSECAAVAGDVDRLRARVQRILRKRAAS